MFILSFSISFVCLVVTLLILCIIPLWDSATAHSPSGKELNPSSQEDARFSGRCTSTYNFYFILRHPFFGTQQQLTHPLVKSSTLPLRKMPVFQGVPPRHTIFTSSCVNPLWGSATAHSSFGKEILHSSLEDTLGIQLSLHPASFLFGIHQQLTHSLLKTSNFPLCKNHVSQGLLFC